jgi:endonuclease III
MRGATECAKRLKQFVSSLRSKVGKVSRPAASDPITQLILGILSRDTPEAKASEGLERLRGTVVDYNELRVIPPIELAATLGDFLDARLKCEDISRALNAVFAEEHTVALDRLADLPRKDVVAELGETDGLDAYTRARIRLLGLGQHAIPLDEAMWALARREGLVDPRCPLDEAQQFLERQVPEDGALEFVALLKKHAWSEMGTAVRKREVERILSVPPDRTSRNMLQLVGRYVSPDAALGGADEPAAELAEVAAALEAEDQPASPPVAEPKAARAPAKPRARSKSRGARASKASKAGHATDKRAKSPSKRAAVAGVRARRAARKSPTRAKSA